MSSAVVEYYRPQVSVGAAVGRQRLRVVGEEERAPARALADLHLTRRGRLALTGTVALVLVLALLSLVGALGPAGASSAVVVQPGMTLSHIAVTHLPDVPLSQAVSDIQRANRLSTTSIAVGQELLIPGR
ncbi:LysM peptidoglycan-binding domain-containing protein [Ornithinimicrobium cerasi]|uniref:LysM peptidoglycan-binding domain-containing protein n=1 Tax=Ornithinimicrobium cerasi TaxID=2248773 RepID=UPI0013795BD3|nr:LysM peptidoglycan-binding domain-containing protein [Ornithinimicrobium cerasi]